MAKAAPLIAKKRSKVRPPKKPVRKTRLKIDERLLALPHSSLKRISKSLEKIENFSADLAEKSGVTGILGRAVLQRAKMIRESLKPKKKSSSKTGKK